MSDGLYIETAGSGRPLVMLHGWGMHGGLFRPLVDALAGRFNVLAVDLPGHGLSSEFAGLADVAAHAGLLLQNIRRITAEPFILLGWSMGGLLAQFMAANFPQHVARLVLVAATPCFVQRDDWESGIAGATLTRFAGELLADYPTTLSRFLALQFFGADEQRDNLRRARELVFARPAPKPDTLQQGLELLEQADLRELLASIACPTFLINGERDTLVPSVAQRYTAEHLPRGCGVILKGAGHAPFLSHAQLFHRHLQRFLFND